MVQAPLKEILQAKETLIFLLQSLSFVIKTKVATKTRESSRDFSSSDKVSKHDVSLASGKVLDFQNKCMQLIESPKTTINQTPTKSLVHYSGSASRENSVQVLAATINPSSERKKSYQAKMKLS